MSSKGNQTTGREYRFVFNPETGKVKKVYRTGPLENAPENAPENALEKCLYCPKKITVSPRYKGNKWACKGCRDLAERGKEEYEDRHTLRRIRGHSGSDSE